MSCVEHVRGFQLASWDSILFVFAQVVSVATKITQIISSVYCGAFPMVSLLIQRSRTAVCVRWYLVQRDGIPPKAEYKELARQIGFQDGDGAIRILGRGGAEPF